MIPKFLGRLPVNRDPPGADKGVPGADLKGAENAIFKQYEKLLKMDEVELSFDEDALEWIAEEALKKETGARALRAILEEIHAGHHV